MIELKCLALAVTQFFASIMILATTRDIKVYSSRKTLTFLSFQIVQEVSMAKENTSLSTANLA